MIKILLLSFSGILGLSAELLVQISQGILNGTIEESSDGRNYSAFLGIPYGKPPVGNLRFRSPVPAEKWDGVRQANSFGNMCYQTIFGIMTFGEEDCLFLNVYTPVLNFEIPPKNDAKQLLPVMFWIHGGAFFFGGGETYRANYLLNKDIILVTFNYRLGIFGFLSTGDSEAPGNFGLKDQLLALKWVQQNIEAFGGDPNRVTIFGQSAGGASVNFHALSKTSDGLFHQVIMQSGVALSPWTFQKRNKLLEFVKKAAIFVLCPTFPTKDLVDCMRRRSAASLLISSNIVGVVTRVGQFTWVPTNEPDAEDAFLTDDPNNLMHHMKDLPLLTGTNTDDGSVFTFFLYTYKIVHLLVKRFLKEKWLYDVDFKLNTEKDFAKKLEIFYLNEELDVTKNEKELDRYTNLLSDGLFIYPEVRMLEKVTMRIESPIYVYNFGYRGSRSFMQSLLKNYKTYGVAHADELMYLFPLKYGYINLLNTSFTTSGEKINKLMVDLWTSFAINGVPTSKELNTPDLWTPYNTQNNIHLQIGNIDDSSDPAVTLSTDLFTERMNFWKNNVPP